MEIRLQGVRARIEALTEYNEGGFELEEVRRLKRQEFRSRLTSERLMCLIPLSGVSS